MEQAWEPPESDYLFAILSGQTKSAPLLSLT
jgi:hypothetical protein